MKIYEPKGMFRILTIAKPWFKRGKIWFTQNLNGQYQLHVGYFDEETNELCVWKTRDIKPNVKLVYVGTRPHRRNPLLDDEIYERIVRVPFLQKAT